MQLADQRGHVEESDISLHLHDDDISSEHGANFVAFVLYAWLAVHRLV